MNLNFYNNYGFEFDSTRTYVWKEVENYVDNLKKNSIVLDVGCGNGKNNYNKDVYFELCDFSKTMCIISKNKNKNVTTANALFLPYRNNCFDCVMCIACIHHMDTYEQRHKVVCECLRVLKTGGSFIFSVWKSNSKYKGDSLIKWKTNDILRYYYMYSYDDVMKHISQLNEKILKYKILNDINNFYIIITKM